MGIDILGLIAWRVSAILLIDKVIIYTLSFSNHEYHV